MQWKRGDQEAPRVLLPLVYDELRRLARHHLRAERSDHTLQSTALVHEAYLRLVKPGSLQLESRQHFFALASQLMREILVDYARGRRAAKRDGGNRLTLDEAAELSGSGRGPAGSRRRAQRTRQDESPAEPHCGIEVLWRLTDWGSLRSFGGLLGHRGARLGCCSSVVAS